MKLEIRELNSELAEKAKIELHENYDRIPDDLLAIKTWLSKQRYIKGRTDDQFLLSFLRGCKFSLQRVKEKLDMYYTIRSAIPEFFAIRDPLDKKIERVIDLGLTLPLPNLSEIDGSRIFLIKQGAYDPHKITIHDVMKVSYMITDILVWEDDHTIISGQTILVDLRGLSFAHLAQFSPTLLKKMTSSIQEAYPIRQKGIHFVNPSAGFDALFKIFYNFMSSKIKERIHVHDTFESLHKLVPKHLLPEEYGGNAGSLQTIIDDWKQRLINHRQWFAEDAIYKTDESKRPGKAKNADILFGTEGSFRSLEFD